MALLRLLSRNETSFLRIVLAWIFILFIFPSSQAAGAPSRICSELFPNAGQKKVLDGLRTRVLALQQRLKPLSPSEIQRRLFNEYQYKKAKKNASHNIFDIREYNHLTHDQIVEVGKIAATYNYHMTAKNFEHYDMLSLAQRLEVAKALAEAEPFVILHRSHKFLNFTPEQTFELMKVVIQNGWYPILAEKSLISRLHPHQLRQLFRLSLDRPLNRSRALSASVSLEAYESPTEVFLSGRIQDQDSIESIKFLLLGKFASQVRVLKKASNIDAAAEVSKLVKYAWNPIERREFGLRLIDEGVRRVTRGRSLPDSAIELVQVVTGLQTDLLPKKISNSTLGDILEVAIDIQHGYFTPVLSGVKLAPDYYQSPAKLVELLTLIRDLKAVQGNNVPAIKSVLAKIESLQGTDWIQELKSEFLVQFAALLRRKDGDKKTESTEFTFEDITSLNRIWGTLEPIYTLAARYRGHSRQDVLISNLKKIFSASIRGDFHKYKFEGLTAEEKKQVDSQLAMLSPAQRTLWGTPRVKIEAFNPREERYHSQSVIDQKSQIQDVINTNLVPHTKDFRDGYASQFNAKSDRAVLDLLLLSKASQDEVLAQLQIPIAQTLLVILKEVERSANSQIELNSPVLSKLLNYADYIHRKNPQFLGSDAVQDISNLKRLVKNEIQGEKSNQFLVMTVLSSDPKFLLTIGDAVKAASCQNYRTGSYIHTLPGYVMDAHVQALVSYSLGVADFKSESDFTSAARMVQMGNAKVSFDGNRKVVRIVGPDGSSVESTSLAEGYLRRIVKLGQDTNTHRPALFLEREYSQSHRATKQMQRQMQQIRLDLAKDLNAQDSDQIEVAGSRNEPGHYSDAAGGIKTGKYIIIPSLLRN